MILELNDLPVEDYSLSLNRFSVRFNHFCLFVKTNDFVRICEQGVLIFEGFVSDCYLNNLILFWPDDFFTFLPVSATNAFDFIAGGL